MADLLRGAGWRVLFLVTSPLWATGLVKAVLWIAPRLAAWFLGGKA